MSRILTLQDVARHKTQDDVWLAIHGKVYDVTKFLDEHP
jgi:cytochrome b involved in lipid metabolism